MSRIRDFLGFSPTLQFGEKTDMITYINTADIKDALPSPLCSQKQITNMSIELTICDSLPALLKKLTVDNDGYVDLRPYLRDSEDEAQTFINKVFELVEFEDRDDDTWNDIEINGDKVGMALVRGNSLTHVQIDQDKRGRRYGEDFVKYIENKFSLEGNKFHYILIGERESPGFWQKQGYRVYATVRRNHGRDFIMWKHLANTNIIGRTVRMRRNRRYSQQMIVGRNYLIAAGVL